MNKTDIAKYVAAEADITQRSAAAVLDALAALAASELEDRGEFLLPDIGRLSVTETAERPGRNPKTGEELTIPAGRKIKFKPFKGLKEATE